MTQTAIFIGMAFAATLAFAAPRAEATPIDYSFQVTVTSGPLMPDTIDGTFAYDSSSVVPGGSKDAAGLLTELDFTLNGISYDASTANTGGLSFDSAGNLTYFTFGNDCDANGCTINAGTNTWVASPGLSRFLYTTPDNQVAVWSGNLTFARSPVPEPGSLALLATALAGFGIFGFIRRHCRKVLAS